MSVWFQVQDHYFKQAKRDGFVARSAYKLEEIDKKFHIFWPEVRTVIGIGCAPGSRLQYVSQHLRHPRSRIIWFDLKKVDIQYPKVTTYQQDVTEKEKVKSILSDELSVSEALWSDSTVFPWVVVDCIISDMAPDTLWDKSTDALRSINLIYDTMRMYQELLKPQGKFVIKVFMWPGFEEFVRYCRDIWWAQHIKVFKPKSCRSMSKETYVIKI